MDKLSDKEISKKMANTTNNLSTCSTSFKKINKKGKKKKEGATQSKGQMNNMTKKKKKKKGKVDIYEDYKFTGKKEICKYYFKRGRCVHNGNCTYSHDVEPIYKVSKLCKFLVQGKCNNPNCIFSHDYNLFFCRNNLIFNSCKNPLCKFKHIKIEESSENTAEYNLQVNKALSNDDKIRFLYNNKPYLTELLIHKYYAENICEHTKIDNIAKNDSFPWYINGVIDLINLDIKYNNADYFFKIVDTHIRRLNTKITHAYNRNACVSEVTPVLNEESANSNYMNEQNATRAMEICNKGSVGDIQKLGNNNNMEDTGGRRYAGRGGEIGSEMIKQMSSDQGNKEGDEKSGENGGEKGINGDEKSGENGDKKGINGDEENFSGLKFYSSEEEEDYSKYLNKYFEIDT
ncbi:zinc finger protein, putative [Plasmodium ovale wallikeri]|uniref:Zinc finger protein, putative n=1 Tax=Plasmodium ovale wallikeri TaxID=864142 RepID=A0A1A8ZEW0_PLAOA|nr:zinc finger protein, putative [Plasmodium ovale wallikeri]SBT42538.1 zinc finger protein, putative [Plasmodium ovale wallikeri]